MSVNWAKPCPKCHSRDRGLWLGDDETGRPWKLVCQTCGLEMWFDNAERAYSEFIEHDENGMVHFDGEGLTMEFRLEEVANGE